MAINDTSNLAPVVRDYYMRVVLETAYLPQVHASLADKVMMPKNNGNIANFRRWNRLATVPIPLNDGVTPPGATIDTEIIKATVQWYGNYVTFTDQVELTIEDDALNSGADLLGHNCGETIDEVVRDVLASTSSVLSCQNGANGGTPTEINTTDFGRVTQAMLGNEAKFISNLIEAGPKFSTAAVRPGFYGIVHTDLLNDLQACSRFQSSANYPGQEAAMPFEWGAVDNIRFLYSSVATKSSAATPVYSNIIVGKQAYGVINFGARNCEFYITPKGGQGDPLHQRASEGWKHPFAARILNDNYMTNLLSTAA